MIRKTTIRRILVLGLFSAVIAGCAGTGSAPPTLTNALQPAPLIQPMLMADAKCKDDHGVSVHPCSVSLSATAPTATVKTKGPKMAVFSYDDKVCSKKSVATVAGSDGTYVVTAGTKSGVCNVTFTAKVGGKTVGTATLNVTNSI